MDNIIHLPSEGNPRVEISPEIGGFAELPVGLDPQEFPIIAAHFYNWRPVGIVAAEIVSDLRSRRRGKRQHAEGLG